MFVPNIVGRRRRDWLMTSTLEEGHLSKRTIRSSIIKWEFVTNFPLWKISLLHRNARWSHSMCCSRKLQVNYRATWASEWGRVDTSFMRQKQVDLILKRPFHTHAKYMIVYCLFKLKRPHPQKIYASHKVCGSRSAIVASSTTLKTTTVVVWW